MALSDYPLWGSLSYSLSDEVQLRALGEDGEVLSEPLAGGTQGATGF